MVRQRPELVKKRPGVGVQVDEDEAFPAFAADRAQIQVPAKRFRAEGFRIGHTLQAPVQVETPVVEGACEAVRKAALAVIDDAVAPMRTDVEEGTDRSIIAAHDDDAFAPQFEGDERSEEHTSELQSLMRISYAVFCLKK